MRLQGEISYAKRTGTPVLVEPWIYMGEPLFFDRIFHPTERVATKFFDALRSSLYESLYSCYDLGNIISIFWIERCVEVLWKRWNRVHRERVGKTTTRSWTCARFNSCLCLFDEGRRGRYLSGYIRTRFEVEALNQGPACFGWRLTNEPMTTSPALARFSRSPLFHLAPTRTNKTIIYSSERASERARENEPNVERERERARTGSGRIERILYAVSRPTPRNDDRAWRRNEAARRRVRSGGGEGSRGGRGASWAFYTSPGTNTSTHANDGQ